MQAYSQLKSGFTLTGQGVSWFRLLQRRLLRSVRRKKCCSVPQKTISSTHWNLGYISFVGKLSIYDRLTDRRITEN